MGNAPDGENALEFIGKIDQVGPAFTGYGYMSYISGVPDDQLFSDPANRSEATARFTFASTANLTARSVLETLFVLNAAGSTTIYYNETPNGDFADATTFSSGTPIAISSERWQNIISVQAPDTAINTGMSQFHQTTATPFTLNGSNYQLGHVDMLLRFSYTGEAKRMDQILPTSTVVVAGNAVVGSGS
ncbi:MAG: hypothetical protein IT320_25610 [Anaerolineae bacterium]|nr:hypothetical protein [Anaerolineae bacterium]